MEEIKGNKIRPLDITSSLLFEYWKYKPNEEDFTYMTVEIVGTEGKKSVKYTYTLYDKYDRKSKMSSMARTTGMTACATAELVLSESFHKTGVHPPEHLGADTHWVFKIFEYLKEKGIHYDLKRTIL